MSLPRVVAPETLDGLAADDPAAQRSRRDLRRVHRVMRTVPIVVRALGPLIAAPRDKPLRILELGAGDGTLMMAVARLLGRTTTPVELTLLDRIALVEPTTIDGYARSGWRAEVATVDVLAWTAEPPTMARWDLIVANLFLHHFEEPALDAILATVAAGSDRFFACEPRRARLALVAAHLTGLIGANAVTREDAVLSVHAGFRAQELVAAWPSLETDWTLHESGAGLFSHVFEARRRSADGL